MATTKLTDENFKKEVINSDIPVVVDFWAAWCGPCKMLGPIFEEVSEDFEGKIKFGKLSTEEYPEVAGQYGVMSIPTMVFFKDGKEIDRIVGAMSKEVLKTEIQNRL